MDINTKLAGALKTMGFDAIRPGQERIINPLLEGEDVIGIMPTGGGKSATFILPTLTKRWRTLVISPLISLQQDQVHKLLQRKVAAAAINSTTRPDRSDRYMLGWSRNQLNFLYIAPERLAIPKFSQFIEHHKPDLIVVDEAHTAGAWGEDFRPSYHLIGPLIEQCRPAPVLVLTATLTPDNEETTRKMLSIPKARKEVYYKRRENLKFETIKGAQRDYLFDTFAEADGPAIMYVPTVSMISQIMPTLKKMLKDKGGVVEYHGQLQDNVRNMNQQMFMTGKAKYVVATNAFGMGVDKEDVRMVLHAGIPGSIEDYAQEAGRGGRDGKDTRCILMPMYKTYDTQKYFMESKNPEKSLYYEVMTILKQSVDSNGVIQIPVSDLSSLTRTNNRGAVGTVISVFKAAGLITSESARYEAVVDVDTVPLSEVPEKYKQKFVRLSQMLPMGSTVLRMPPKDLAAALSMNRIKGMDILLKEMEDEGLIIYTPASRANKITLIDTKLGPAIDWDRLEKKRKTDLKRMLLMREFADIPDEDKHKALESYFTTGKLPD